MCHASVTAFTKTSYSIQIPISRFGCMWYQCEVTQRINSLTSPEIQYFTIWVVQVRFQLSVQQCVDMFRLGDAYVFMNGCCIL